MNPEALAQLKDIHMPSDVAWWPLAPGWWILLGFFLLVVGVAIYLFIRSLKKSRQEIIVGQSLELFHDIKDKSLSPKELLTEVSELLRRTAISLYGREATAKLAGNEWLEFLNRKGKTRAFTEGVGQALKDQPYRQAVEYNQQALLGLTHNWLKKQMTAPLSNSKKESNNKNKRGKHA